MICNSQICRLAPLSSTFACVTAWNYFLTRSARLISALQCRCLDESHFQIQLQVSESKGLHRPVVRIKPVFDVAYFENAFRDIRAIGSAFTRSRRIRVLRFWFPCSTLDFFYDFQNVFNIFAKYPTPHNVRQV